MRRRVHSLDSSATPPLPCPIMYAFIIVMCLGVSRLAGTHHNADEGQVRAWISDELERSQTVSSPVPIHFTWRMETWTSVMYPDVVALRQRVQGRPEHPERGHLAALEAEIKSGKPETATFELWLDPSGYWRFNSDLGPAFSRDAALGGTDAWVLGRDFVEVFASDIGAARPTGHPGAERNVFWPMVGRFRFGGLERVGAAAREVKSVSLSGDRFTAQIENETGTLAFSIDGEWNPQAQRGFVKAVEITRYPGRADVVGTREIFLDWRPSADGGWVCDKVDLYKPGQAKPWRRLFLEGATEVSAADFKRIIATPRPGDKDAVRGALPGTLMVVDRRAGERRWVDMNGTSHVEPLADAPAARTSPLVSTRALGLTILFSGLAAGALWYWYRVRAVRTRRVFRVQ